MFSFKGRQTPLERRLSAERPAPPSPLVDEIVSRFEAEPSAPVRSSAARMRRSLALAVAVAMVVALSAFGGLGYAQNAVTQVAEGTAHAVKKVASRPSGDSTAAGPSRLDSRIYLASIGTYQPNQWICHYKGGPINAAGQWDVIQLTDLSVYTAHSGHTQDHGPYPTEPTKAFCAANHL